MKLNDLRKQLEEKKGTAAEPGDEVIDTALLDTVSGAKTWYPPVWGQWNMSF